MLLRASAEEAGPSPKDPGVVGQKARHPGPQHRGFAPPKVRKLKLFQDDGTASGARISC